MKQLLFLLLILFPFYINGQADCLKNCLKYQTYTEKGNHYLNSTNKDYTQFTIQLLLARKAAKKCNCVSNADELLKSMLQEFTENNSLHPANFRVLEQIILEPEQDNLLTNLLYKKGMEAIKKGDYHQANILFDDYSFVSKKSISAQIENILKLGVQANSNFYKGQLKKAKKLYQNLNDNYPITASYSLAQLEEITRTYQVFNEAVKESNEAKKNVLNLSEKGLKCLPAEIGQLDKLEELYLEYNLLIQLPPEIGQLKKLKLIKLWGNPHLELSNFYPIFKNSKKSLLINPDYEDEYASSIKIEVKLYEKGRSLLNIGQLENLKVLSFYAHIKALPSEIGQLKNVERLEFCQSKLTQLPPEIGQLKKLANIDLSDNLLISLPKEIGQLKNLKVLRLYDNKLTTFPNQFSQLKQLEKLDLGKNQLITLPKIGEFKALVKLFLYYNQLLNLPAGIGQLKNLEELYLTDNQLTTLPVEIGQLEKLHQLEIKNNQLINLPAEIGKLRNLGLLYLSNNQLTKLPVEIGQLKNLKILDVSNNQLTELPIEIKNIEDLWMLELSNNNFSKSEIDKIKKWLPDCTILVD